MGCVIVSLCFIKYIQRLKFLEVMAVDRNENPFIICTVLRRWSSFEKIVKIDMVWWKVDVK
jgi:hypothetical protein